MESILGASSEIVDKYYTHIGDDAQRQAIEAISDETNQNSLAERIQKVIALIDSNPEPTLILKMTVFFPSNLKWKGTVISRTSLKPPVLFKGISAAIFAF